MDSPRCVIRPRDTCGRFGPKLVRPSIAQCASLYRARFVLFDEIIGLKEGTALRLNVLVLRSCVHAGSCMLRRKYLTKVTAIAYMKAESHHQHRTLAHSATRVNMCPLADGSSCSLVYLSSSTVFVCGTRSSSTPSLSQIIMQLKLTSKIKTSISLRDPAWA